MSKVVFQKNTPVLNFQKNHRLFLFQNTPRFGVPFFVAATLMERSPQPVRTDEQLIADIREGGRARNAAWQYIYRAWRPLYLKPVLDRGGKAEEVQEVLSKVRLDVEKQVCREDFHLHSSSLRTYFIDALINAWSEAGRKRSAMQSKVVEYDPQAHAVGGHQAGVEETYIREERARLVRNAVEQTGARCQKMLTLYGKGFSMEEIAGEMDFVAGADTAKKEVAKCRERLREFLRRKPL